ncbi:class I SAM-dependent DNA methyltransferase [Corynebacterium hansenii]|uniref:Class I SAM-dependent DNA methyltransferase n=1 Tax=Corynebacterium hansenii TaxID=394964 RepID=A0ABV7ZPR1_9CORY|nr:N-6 DNA methylase [Corynebacterium hansenii]WJY98715.1 Modification methylase [Corynebacterium hansenii]
MSRASVVLREGDTHEYRKDRGAFFTPVPVARYLADRTVGPSTSSVLEPSCGEAVFLLAASELTESTSRHVKFAGIDLHRPSVEFARSLLSDVGVEAEMVVGDFFDVPGSRGYDAILGNPPFVRFHRHAGTARAKALTAARRAGVELNELASSWAPFVAHATSFLAPGGSLGFVLPAELLYADYAAPIRAMLIDRFRDIELTLFDERVFPDVQEEVVLLAATGYGIGPAESIDVLSLPDSDALIQTSTIQADDPRSGTSPGHQTRAAIPPAAGGRWTSFISGTRADELISEQVAVGNFSPLSSWGTTRLGAVTGANKFFAITKAEREAWGIPESEVMRISPPGSKHLRNLELSAEKWRDLTDDGLPTLLFRPDASPSPAAQRKLREGMSADVDQAYKCRVRSPWWRTPVSTPPDLLLTYMNARTPQLATNSAGVRHLNSIHGVYLHEPVRELARELLPLVALNSATAVDAEFTGRGYGGGLLKLEPGEAARWAVPSPALVTRIADDLRSIKHEVMELLEDGEVDAAVSLVDDVVLPAAGFDGASKLRIIEERSTLQTRRTSRSKRRK